MKRILFISYSDDNLDKVELIKKELINHPYFEPMIVAFNREPNKALVKKVTDGIDSSLVIIPILT
jgi:lipopolysaccharide biosynthesis protein